MVDICVIGAGYVGLVTGACLSYLGNKVIVVDSNSARISELKHGKIPFFEPGLAELVKSTVGNKLLDFTEDLANAVKQSQVIYIAVGTPPLPSGEPDLSQVISVASQIGGALDTRCKRIIVNKSTVPVGSGNWVEMLVNQGLLQKQEKQPVALTTGKSAANSTANEAPTFSVVSNPEFLREGSAIADSFYPDRIVIGSNDSFAADLMKALYQPIIEQSFSRPSFVSHNIESSATVPFVVTDLASAELIKYAANAFLALKISFANEIAGLCERAGADIREVSKGIGLDKRIGQYFLNAGIGWGGSCFGKDVRALIESAREYNYPTPILEASISVNERQRKVLIGKLQEELKILKGRTIGLMGLSFKPDTDDLRDAPSLTIANQLIKMGAFIKAYDPVSNDVCRAQNPDLPLTYCSSVLELSKNCDALLLVTEWDEFRHVNWHDVAKEMRSPLIIDGRNILNKEELAKAGFNYRGIGR